MSLLSPVMSVMRPSKAFFCSMLFFYMPTYWVLVFALKKTLKRPFICFSRPSSFLYYSSETSWGQSTSIVLASLIIRNIINRSVIVLYYMCCNDGTNEYKFWRPSNDRRFGICEFSNIKFNLVYGVAYKFSVPNFNCN